VQGVLALYGAPAHGVRIEREVAPGLLVQADRDQLTQVLINLLANAGQAMPGGGRVMVRVLAAGESEVGLEVEDEGPGVPAGDRARIFEPYYTTKTGGTGLGLAIGLRIAQEHNGRLEELGLDRPGSGARFRLTLPRDCAGPI
jgi:two-component system, NtrC family, nitrogen regulation sensor histidine kinase NtrY